MKADIEKRKQGFSQDILFKKLYWNLKFKVAVRETKEKLTLTLKQAYEQVNYPKH